MIYPVQKSYLKDNIATDDEQATLIVIEAIVSDSFSNLDFSQGIDSSEIFNSVKNWNRYAEFSQLIASQKALFNSVLGASVDSDSNTDINDNFKIESIKSAIQATTLRDLKAKKRQKLLGALAAAACLLVVVSIGISSLLGSLNSGTKSSSNRVASVQTTTTNPEKTLSSNEPTDNQTKFSAGADSQVDSIEPPASTSKSNGPKMDIESQNTSSEASNGSKNPRDYIVITSIIAVLASIGYVLVSRKYRS